MQKPTPRGESPVPCGFTREFLQVTLHLPEGMSLVKRPDLEPGAQGHDPPHPALQMDVLEQVIQSPWAPSPSSAHGEGCG